MVNSSRVIETFMQLVKIDSETGNERAICDELKNRLTELGLDVVEDNSAGHTGHGAGNLVANIRGSHRESPPVFFTAHMDTVSPGQSIQPSVVDGKIVSDGTTILGSDDKAGIAAMLEAIYVLREQHATPGPAQFVITSGEESSLAGSRAFQGDLLKAEYGFALDSNGPVGDIIVAAPTQARLNAVITGKSAHAGVNPEDGVSAIQVASQAITRMSLGRIDRDTTANIGRFAGGHATNVVCDRVEVSAEARSLQKDKMEKQVNRMVLAFETAAQENATTVDVETEVMYPSYRFTEQDAVVRHAMKAMEAIGRKSRLLTSGGGSDANIFSGMGVPTINLGIGYEQIHTTKESIPVRELIKTAELVLALIQTT